MSGIYVKTTPERSPSLRNSKRILVDFGHSYTLFDSTAADFANAAAVP